jgi:hypothetical protein
VSLLRALNESYRPFVLQIPIDPATKPALAQALPFIANMTLLDGRATAYVCRDFTCAAPTTDAETMLKALGEPFV